MNKYEQIWTYINKYHHIWININKYEQVSIDVNKYQQTQQISTNTKYQQMQNPIFKYPLIPTSN